MTKNVRVRFAPSPTGPLHIGGVRTALFNYLFAKSHGGQFILRIEDTDQNRYVPGAESYILESLKWCGITPDESPIHPGNFGPYRQSERKHIYKDYAAQLIDTDHAYYAFDTPEELGQLRETYEREGKTFIYNWHNRHQLHNSLTLSPEDTTSRIASGMPYVIRFRNPKDETLHLTDIIRGAITIDTNTLDDKVLFKSDGMPTYHLANIVDDHLMEISHVIRGEEWLPSLALHHQLYQALKWKRPEFAHLPLILKPKGKGKLSKRDGDKLGFPVFPMQWIDPQTKAVSRGYKEDGYFAAALVNFLAFLGWNPGTDEELFSLDNLISKFDLNRVHKSGARFDPDKTKWFNHHYMQLQDNSYLARLFQDMTPELNTIDLNYIALVIAQIKERATFISDFWELSHFFFIPPSSYDPKASKKAFKEDTKSLLHEILELITSINDFNPDTLQSTIKTWITQNDIGFGRIMMPLRLALVGTLKGPDVFDIMFLIGKFETLKRIEASFTHMP